MSAPGRVGVLACSALSPFPFSENGASEVSRSEPGFGTLSQFVHRPHPPPLLAREGDPIGAQNEIAKALKARSIRRFLHRSD